MEGGGGVAGALHGVEEGEGLAGGEAKGRFFLDCVAQLNGGCRGYEWR